MKKSYFIFLIPWLLAFHTAHGQEIRDERGMANNFEKNSHRGDCNGKQVMFGGQQYLCNSLTWKLVFEDSFDGNTLDLSKWSPWAGVPRDIDFEIQKAWHTPENIEISNGILKVISKKLNVPYTGTWVIDDLTDPPTTKTATFDYTTGEIWTKPKFVQGKLTARIKIPKGWGFSPAFWMFGNPPWNEIDVFEFDNDRNNLSKIHRMSVHYNGNVCSNKYTGPDFSQDFHIFTMTWDKDKIEFYVDGVLKGRYARYYNLNGQESGCTIYPYTTYIEKPFPRDPMSIILNVAIRHNDGNDPDDTTPFPSQMEVDYVRFYQKLPCYSESTLITDPATLNIKKNGAFNSVVGTTIKMGDGFTLDSTHLSAIAEDKIVLQAGFTAKAGCSFTAKIDPSACSSSKGMEDEIDEDEFFATEEVGGIMPEKMELENKVTDIRVFPNPTNDKLFIEIPYHHGKVAQYKIQMLNAQGKILQTFETEHSINIDANHYLSGLYLLNVVNMETGEAIIIKSLNNDVK